MARTNVTPAQRALIGRIGGYAKAAKYGPDATLPARQAALKRFEREVDPNNELPENERLRRAEAAKKAFFSRIALKSAQVRSRRARKDP